MEQGQIDMILAGFIVILAIIMLWFYAKSKHKISKFLFGVLSGIALLYPASLIVQSFNGALNVNLFTLSVSGVLGIPGVLTLSICAFL